MWPFKKKKADPFAASQWDEVVQGGRTRERRHMRHWWQWAALSLVIVLLGGAGVSAWLYLRLQGRIQEPIPDVVPNKGGDAAPFNALLVGTDARTGLTPEEQLSLGAADTGTNLSDTIILAHVDPESDRVTMVQFPRDLYVPIADGGTQKINSAYSTGRANLVRTIENITHLDINNYAEVNLAGFRDLVDAVGGVDICITEPIPFDPNTGIEIAEEDLGMVHFDGDKALRYVRSRHAFSTGDFARIENQQKFLSAALNKVTSISTFFNIGRLRKLYSVAGDNVRTDDHTTIKGLYDLLKRFRSFDPDGYEAYTAPNLGTSSITLSSGQPYSVVQPDWPAIEVLFKAIKKNESPAEADGVPDIDPSTIRVGVYNGVSPEAFVAAPAAEELEASTTIASATGTASVEIAEVTNAHRFGYQNTKVRYEPGAEKMAELVGAALPGAEVKEGPTKPDIDVEVIVGESFETKKLLQILPIPIPTPGKLPEICETTEPRPLQ
ncbi:MAG TPA: LCP family protein [Actinomycetota bacterium]|jgi:LCP family protein required for cell wall assembly